MSDSIRTRVARVIAGGAHALVDRIEGQAPVAMLEQSVREVVALTGEVRTELGRVVANRHMTNRQHQALDQELESLNASIAVALEAGKDDLARAGVARQIDIEAQLPVLEVSLNDLRTQEADLTGFIEALLGKKREMESTIGDFEATRRVADQGATAVSPNGSIAGRLSDIESGFDRTLRRQTGVDGATGGVDLKQAAQLNDLGKLVRDSKIEERLQAIKDRR